MTIRRFVFYLFVCGTLGFLIGYGLATDCPNTAGYVYCPKNLR